jgi:hypothetical protein
MSQSAGTGTIINNPGIPQFGSMARTTPGNPDVKNPPNNEGREAIVASRPKVGFGDSPKIDKWMEAPASGSSILGSQNGSIQWLPNSPSSGTYVLGVVDGNIQWLQTEDCDEE